MYDGIINLVQQKGSTLIISLKYLTCIIETMQEEVQKDEEQRNRDLCVIERFFVHQMLN